MITVQTGAKSNYAFRLNDVTRDVQIDMNGHEYHSFDGDKPQTAIKRLMERAAELEAFFEACRKISVTEYFSHRLEGFIERADVDDDNEEAYELVAQMIEEADRNEGVFDRG